APALERGLSRGAGATHQRRQTIQAREEWLADVRRRFPRFEDFHSPVACSLEEGRTCLEKNEVGLLYVLGAAESYLILVEPGEVSLLRLPKAGGIAEGVESVLDLPNLRAVRSRSLAAPGSRLLIAHL